MVDYLGDDMAVLHAPTSPTHELGGTRFTSLATPALGATDTAVWTVEILPGTPATPHSLTREEVFVVLEGTASVRIAGAADEAGAGDAIVVPAGAMFELSNAGAEPLRMLCCLPVGGQARLADGSTFTPPWAQ
ncbi:MAG TPA: cupin domain-containing protein [Acidimicrobiales bacterium]|nr:cupin domain-containing protein [Acidimicrobiales bacterium]